MSTESPSRRRTIFRFTLRILLVAMTALCLGLGVWTHRAREQRRIVERIQQWGGMVCYERDGPEAPEPRNFAVEWLAGALGRDYFERVDEVLIHDRATIEHAVQLPRLKALRSYDIALTDQDLEPLVRCRYLKSLMIRDSHFHGDQTLPKSRITDKSLALIAELPMLEVAELHGTGFTRVGIDALARSPRLTSLEIGLCDSSVVASDFDDIKRIGRIRSLRALHATPSDDGSGIKTIVRW
jgi:hypothetical protein